MWIVFLVTVPQLRTSYELRLSYEDDGEWTALVLPDQKPPTCFTGDRETTATDLWSYVLASIGAGGLVPAGD